MRFRSGLGLSHAERLTSNPARRHRIRLRSGNEIDDPLALALLYGLDGKNECRVAGGAFAFSGTQGYSRNLWDGQYREFGPRVGLAYRVMENFVVRAGYGLTYLPTNTV